MSEAPRAPAANDRLPAVHRFWTTAQLLDRGKSERQIRRAVESGAMRSVRKGHLTAADTPPPFVRAVRIGGVLTGPSAAKSMGLWTPPDPVPGVAPPRSARDEVPERLHVAANRGDHRLRDPDDHRRPLRPRADVVVHRVDSARIDTARSTGIAPVLLVLEHVLLTFDPALAIAVLDSALHQRHLHPADLVVLAAALPPRLRPVVAAADGRAESGLESIVRYRLRLVGLRVEVLVGIPGVGTVDLVIEGRLIVECDGQRYHHDDDAFTNDRRRDLAATTARYRTLRLTWYRILFCWDEVEAAVLAALGTR